MDTLTCNEFKKQFEAVFGKCEFHAESGEIVKQSANFVSDEGMKEMGESIVHYQAPKAKK
jgi:hypothetical protein